MGDREVLDALDALMSRIATADSPYWEAADVGGEMLDAMETSELAVDQYLLWAWFTDWYELEPEERPQAQEAMRQAAQAWAAVHHNEASYNQYFAHWAYDVIGVKRPWRRRLRKLVTPWRRHGWY